MREIILCKFGEIALKGANRSSFEAGLVRELRRRASPCGNFKVKATQSTVLIEPQDDAADIDAMYETASRVFGIAGITRCAVAEKSIDAILKTAVEYLAPALRGKRRFRADAKRSDKTFPMKSPELSARLGGALLAAFPSLRVDLHTPEVTAWVEVRDEYAYIHADQERGAGGMPLGSAGRGLLLLSGGIDSPVAGYMMAKRGLEIEALHFESYPYTSDRAREKVMTLAEELCAYCSRIHVHVISLTHIQEELRDKCEEDYFTLLLRIFMMTLAERCATQYKCSALVTGESLSQVASQTLPALCVTDSVVSMPIFRPCIGMDKEEIVAVSRKIGTFETSTLPYEDCCTVFTPRHPRTKPVRERVLAELQKVDFEGLLDEAYATMTTETKLIFDGYR